MENEWIDWVYTPEKPYPETLGTLVHVKFRDGGEEHGVYNVGYWHCGFFDPTDAPEVSSWHQNGDDSEIIAYQIVSP